MNKLNGLVLGLLFLVGGGAYAQDSTGTTNEDCQKFRSLYYQYLQQKMYNDAAWFWSEAVRSCGESGLDAGFFKNGRYIYNVRLKEVPEDNAARQKELKDSLYWIHEARMKYVYDPEWSLDYAAMLVGDKSENTVAMDSLFKNIHVLKEDCEYLHIRQYFMYLILYKFNGAPAEEKDNVRTLIIEEYIKLSEYVATGKAKLEAAGEDTKYKDAAQDFLDKYFLKIAQDCEVLTPVLDKKFENLPTEKEARLAEVNKFVKLMEKQRCTESETYSKFVMESVNLNPTAAGYYGLGTVYLTKGEDNKAIEAFEKAIELEGEGAEKDNYTFALGKAQYKSGSYRSAFSTFKQVNGKNRGEALYYAAGCIAALANSCGDSTFERKANYWLANDYVKRAIAAGYTEASSSKYLSSAPTSSEVFDNNYQSGQSISLSCWGESVTIP